VRHSFWSEIYETVLTVYLLPVTLATLLDPRRGRFNVTDKGGTLDEGFFDLKAVGPNMILAFALILGVIFGIYGLAANPPQSLEFQAFALNLFWGILCLLTVLGGIAVGRERRQVRERARITARVPTIAILPDGRQVAGVSEDLSLGGAAMVMARPEGLADDALITVEFDIGTERIFVPAELLRWQNDRLQVRFAPQTLQDESAIVQVVLGRADAWLEWDQNRPDRPMRSMFEVVRSISGLFAGGSQFSRRRKGGGAIGSQAPTLPHPGADAPARPALVRPAVPAAVALALLLGTGAALAQAPRSPAAPPAPAVLLPAIPAAPAAARPQRPPPGSRCHRHAPGAGRRQHAPGEPHAAPARLAWADADARRVGSPGHPVRRAGRRGGDLGPAHPARRHLAGAHPRAEPDRRQPQRGVPRRHPAGPLAPGLRPARIPDQPGLLRRCQPAELPLQRPLRHRVQQPALRPALEHHLRQLRAGDDAGAAAGHPRPRPACPSPSSTRACCARRCACRSSCPRRRATRRSRRPPSCPPGSRSRRTTAARTFPSRRKFRAAATRWWSRPGWTACPASPCRAWKARRSPWSATPTTPSAWCW
jgi:hypothetical protein